MFWLLQEKTKAGFFFYTTFSWDWTKLQQHFKKLEVQTGTFTDPYAYVCTYTQAVWASYQHHKQIHKRDRWTDTRRGTRYGDRWMWRMDDENGDTEVHVCKYSLQPLKRVHKITFKPNVVHSLGAKATYVQTHNQPHSKKNNNSLGISADFGTSRIWQKKRLEDEIQTIIKTKCASFLAQRRGDQWEIGRNMRNVCFWYRQPTLMFLIGLKWMGSSRVLK